jgi:uncharacterized protein (TIGR03067 family)
MCFATACAAVAGELNAMANKDEIANALEVFAGAWEIATVEPEGATKDARCLVFNKDGTYSAQDKDGKELWAGTFEIDPTAAPKVWDHRSLDAKKEGNDVLGIYDLDRDNLKVACVVGQWKNDEWKGKPRLTDFDPKKADVIIELKRARSDSDFSHLSKPNEGTVMLNQLPEVANSLVQTTNGNDPTGFIALFDADAVVDDAGRIIQGRDAIRIWAASDIFAVKVTYGVLETSGDENEATITAEIDGTFDRTGLPDPLIMTFEIVAKGGKIRQLTCRLAQE